MTPWVLLRGWGREREHWGDFPARLAREFPGDRIDLPDLPGNGSRHRERSPASIAAMTRAVRADVARDRPVRVLALSMGAMVAIDWASRHPDEVAALVLVNTSARPYAGIRQRLRPASYAAVARAAFAREPASRESHVLELTSRLRAHEPAVARQWERIARERPVSRANLLRQLWAAARFRAPALPPGPRVLVVSSAGDRLVDPRCSENLARAWKAPHRLHPSAGHDLALDDGDWLARCVREWLTPS